MKYNKDFHLQLRGRKLVRVQSYSAKNHQILKEGLLKEKIPFHTFTRKDELRPKAVIKGLPKFLQGNIEAELESLGFIGVKSSELKTLKPTDCPPVLVQLPSTADMGRFKQIRYLFSCVIKIERYKPTKKLGTQCFRCQSFGHASRNCNRPARCVKCALAHPSWECPKEDREEPARCCNCQQEHPANYSQCSERLKYLERIESKRDSLRKTLPLKATDDMPVGQSSWAQVVRSTKNKPQLPIRQHNARAIQETSEWKNKSKQPANPITYSKLIPTADTGDRKTSHDSLTGEMLEILTTIQSIKIEFSRCKTFMDKVILILSHLGQYV